MPSSCRVLAEKPPFEDTIAALNIEAPAALAKTSNSAHISPREPNALFTLRRTADWITLTASSGAFRGGGAQAGGCQGAAATRWSYWAMLQVKGRVAVRPWSAFVATPLSSWTVTT